MKSARRASLRSWSRKGWGFKSLPPQIIFLIVFSVCLTLQAGEESASEAIAPVYEQLLGHKTIQLWNELIQKNKIRQEESFSLVDWEGGKIASRVLMLMERKKGAPLHWDKRSCPPCDVSRGIIFLNADDSRGSEKKLKDAAQFLRRFDAGFLIVFHEKRGELLGRFFAEEGLGIIEEMRESELEFLKDPSGRQAVDLSDEKVVEPVYERLVHGGLNPVQAWPLAEEAMRRFRSSDRRILVVGQSENS